jgi:23S rRNA (guanosine2251-2'-O)-methyltransferase
MSRPGPDVVYGRNPVRELLLAARRAVHEVWCLAELTAEPWLAPLDPKPRSRAELGRACGSSDHQGVVAFCAPYPYAEPSRLVAASGPVVCLDGAQDPRNLGAVARVADAAAAAGLVLTRRGSPGVTPTVSKASAGAVEHLSVARVESLPGFLHAARDAGRHALGADPLEGDDYREAAFPLEVVLVLGSEGGGLRPRVRAACDRLVRIPMAGRVASLNLSVAAALLLFEARRRVDAPAR